MKLRNIWFSFFKVCSIAVLLVVIVAFPFGSGFPPPSPRRAVGFPLQSLTWEKGTSPLGFIFWNTGCFPPQHPLPTTSAGCMVGSGRNVEKTNRTHPSVPLPGTKFIIGISLSRPSLSRMNGNSYFTFAVISSIRFVIFSMEYFSINLLFAASVFSLSLINFSWGRSDWQHSFKYSISVP